MSLIIKLNNFRLIGSRAFSFILLLTLLNCGAVTKKHTIQYTDGYGNPVSLFSVEKGSGIPVILIHGNSFDHTVWKKQFESDQLKNYRLIAYDLRGHGKSIHFNEPLNYKNQYSLKLHAEDLSAVLKYYGLKEAILVGWSLGGNITLHYLSNHFQPPVKQALIFGTTPSFGASGEKQFPGGLPNLSGYFLKEFFLNRTPTQEAIRAFSRAAIQKSSDSGDLLSDDEILYFSRVVASTDGYARIGVTDGLKEMVADLTDGKLDMNSVTYDSYNFSQVELISKIQRIGTPVRVILSSNDFFSMDQVKYLEKLNPEKISISQPYRVGHAVFYSEPELFHDELNKLIASSIKSK